MQLWGKHRFYFPDFKFKHLSPALHSCILSDPQSVFPVVPFQRLWLWPWGFVPSLLLSSVPPNLTLSYLEKDRVFSLFGIFSCQNKTQYLHNHKIHGKVYWPQTSVEHSFGILTEILKKLFLNEKHVIV